jgi:hypothetical protein
MDSWSAITDELLKSVPGNESVFRTCIEQYRQALVSEPGGEYTLYSLEVEDHHHLNLADKAEIIRRALFSFDGTFCHLEHLPPPDNLVPFPNALRAFGHGCSVYLDAGTKVDRGACGELVSYRKFEKFRGEIKRDSPWAMYSDEDLKKKLGSGSVTRDAGLLDALCDDNRKRAFSTLATWVAEHEKEVARNKKHRSQLPDEVRDLLGCPHFHNCELVELRFAEVSVRKPTLADSGGYPPFLPSGGARYGTGRNLRVRGDPRIPGVTGGPELWHEAAAGVTGVRFVGRTGASLMSPFWTEFAESTR